MHRYLPQRHFAIQHRIVSAQHGRRRTSGGWFGHAQVGQSGYAEGMDTRITERKPRKFYSKWKSTACDTFQILYPQTFGEGDCVYGGSIFSSPFEELKGLSYIFDYNNARFMLLDQFTRTNNTNYNDTSNNNIIDLEAAKKLLREGLPPKDVSQNLGVSIPTLYRWCPAVSREN
jgi:hypothetical protein